MNLASATFSDFTSRYRLRAKRDPCGDRIIPARFGHLYEHGSGAFGLALEDSSTGPSRARTLRSRRRQAVAAGFQVHQEGDGEAILLFDPADAKQARLAIRLVGAKRKRVLSAAQLEVLRKATEASQILRNQRAGAAPERRNDDSPEIEGSPSGGN